MFIGNFLHFTEVRMTNERAIELLNIERQCVGSNCDRDCANCELVQEEDELLEMYEYVIRHMKNGGTP